MSAFEVLVVEDDAFQALDLGRTLITLGCGVLGPVGSRVRALALLEETRPDLALVDVRLGDGDVVPVAERLATARVPFALVSGYPGGRFGHPLLDAAPYLGKPWTERGLRGCMGRLFRADLERKLAVAERHVTDGQARVARQASIVARLLARGQDTTLAEQVLRGMERSLELMRAHRRYLLDQARSTTAGGNIWPPK